MHYLSVKIAFQIHVFHEAYCVCFCWKRSFQICFSDKPSHEHLYTQTPTVTRGRNVLLAYVLSTLHVFRFCYPSTKKEP